MLTHHLLDSMAAVMPLERVVGARPARALDVGSGGGLPGIVLAIMAPRLAVTCVDAVDKKASFIRQAAGELLLSNVLAEHARVEVLQAAPFDVITSRAFSSLVDLVTLTRRHLASGGVWMAMKARNPDDELAALPEDIAVFHVEPLQVPGLGAPRCLVWMKPREAS
jgi:16S rRNA (guanine527-N7)-methyltransferase